MKTIAGVLFTLMCAGCVEDGAEDIDVHPDFATVGLHTYVCSQDFCSWDLGSSDGRTCFLAGIHGNLAGGNEVATGGDVHLLKAGGYAVYGYSALHNPITIEAVCVTGAMNRKTIDWSSGNGATYLSGGTAQRRCFLTQLENRTSATFSHYADSVTVRPSRNAGEWYLSGALPAGADVDGQAVCIDATDVGGWAYGNDTGGAYTSSPLYDAGDVACGLTSVGGVLSSGSTGPWLSYTNGVNPFWSLLLGAHQSGAATCVK